MKKKKLIDEAEQIAKELAGVLKHNKELTDDENFDLLVIAIECRILDALHTGYDLGKESVIPVSDVSMYDLGFRPGQN